MIGIYTRSIHPTSQQWSKQRRISSSKFFSQVISNIYAICNISDRTEEPIYYVLSVLLAIGWYQINTASMITSMWTYNINSITECTFNLEIW